MYTGTMPSKGALSSKQVSKKKFVLKLDYKLVNDSTE